jgi:hypothetical protein
MIDKFFEITASFGLPVLWGFPLLVAANLFALFIAQIFFPLKLKIKTWEWESQRKAREEFIEAVSRVDFIARGYVASELSNKFSFAGLSLLDTEKELLSILKKMHNEGQKIRPYLSNSERKLFDNFLSDLAEAYDEAKDCYNQWNQDDQMAEEQHSLNLIEAHANIARNILQSLVKR